MLTGGAGPRHGDEYSEGSVIAGVVAGGVDGSVEVGELGLQLHQQQQALQAQQVQRVVYSPLSDVSVTTLPLMSHLPRMDARMVAGDQFTRSSPAEYQQQQR